MNFKRKRQRRGQIGATRNKGTHGAYLAKGFSPIIWRDENGDGISTRAILKADLNKQIRQVQDGTW